MMLFEADLPFENFGPMISWVAGGIGVLTIYVLALKSLSLTHDVFGRQPPLDIDVKKIEARVARLEVVMERLATKEALSQLERDFHQTLDEKFQSLDAKRSRDTSELHKHVELTSNNFHRRLNDVSAALGDEIKRLPNEVFQMLKNAASLGIR